MAEPTLILAAFAGLASFLSPCMLPVIPAFLAQLAGTSLDLSDLQRRDVLLGTVLFVLRLLGRLRHPRGGARHGLAGRCDGGTGVALTTRRHGRHRPRAAPDWVAAPAGTGSSVRGASATLKPGNLASFLFGASFAVAWTPCVGPDPGQHAGPRHDPAGLGLPAAARLRPRSRGAVLARRPVPLAGLLVPQTTPGAAARVHVAFGVVLIGMGVLVFTDQLNLLANFPLLNEVLL